MLEDKQQFLDVFKDYLVQEGIYVNYINNERKRFTVGHRGNNCKWRIHVSPLQDGLTYMIKPISNKHACAKTQYNPATSTAWIAKKLYEDVKAYPSMPVKYMAKLPIMRHGVVRDVQVVRKPTRIILNMIEGKHEKGYENLPKYLKMSKDTNPGSVTFTNWQQPEEDGQRPFFRGCSCVVMLARRVFEGL